MARLLEGKNAVITGANRGIGLATARLFAREGANIWACCRKADDALRQELQTLAAENGVWIEPVEFDLTDGAAMKDAVMQIRGKKEKIDILVNNAGVEQQGALFQMTAMDAIRQVFEVNFFAQVAFSQYLTKLMARTGGGSVVNLASVAALDMTAGYLAYSASKAAIVSATKTMAAELSAQGVRVNAVAPGIAKTDMAMGLTEAARENTVASSLMQRIADPEEIAQAIAFLASDRASYITGQIYRVDGGMA